MARGPMQLHRLHWLKAGPAHNKLPYKKKNNHWKLLDLILDLNYFSFQTLIQTLTRHTYLNTTP